MEVSVEELLQTKSVDELRSIVSNLHKESNNKRQELQLMVGSRYHEFIESADTIADMWTNASTLAEQLTIFTEKCGMLVQQGNQLLQATACEYRSGQDDYFPSRITDQAVWDCLDECDVYGAAVLIAVAAYNHSSAASPEGTPVLMYLDKPAQRYEKRSDEHTRNDTLAADYSSVLFLSQTVADDAQLLLLDNELTLEQRCQILMSVRYLQGLDDLQCMRKFLDAQAVLLDEACDGLSAQDLKREQLATKLNEAVGLLQRCLLDAYLTFVSECPSNLKESVSQQAAKAKDVFTLFDVYKVEFGLRVEKRCRAAGTEDVVLNKETAWKKTTSVDALREEFFEWIMVHITRIAKLAKDALSKLQSAAEVSRLQRLVWQQATRYMQDPDSVQHEHDCYNAQTWADASNALLRSPNPRSKSRTPLARDDRSLLLWSLLFRSTFLQQVESILASASMSALTRFRQCINELLNPEGITIDWENDARVQVESRPIADKTSSASNISRRTRTHHQFASASRLHRQAEVLCSMLHNETSNLMGDSWLPIEQGDLQSSESFATALYYSYCQLVASLMCTVRVLSLSIQSALLEEETNRTPDRRSVLLDAMLILGRFAWLLKSRSKFLEAAFELPKKVHISSVDKVAVDQLRSAFEIADTDGDGMLVTVEIQEAIHAVTDNVADIDYSHVPSLTFVEFCLFCAKLLDDVQPVSWLSTCLDHLLAFTHEIWAEHVLAASASTLNNGLHDLLFIPSDTGEVANVTCREHFDLWQQVPVTFEGESGTESTEQVFLPVKPSPPLSSFLLYLETRIQTSILCSESLQHIPASYPFAGEYRDFVALVARALRQRAVTLLADTYSMLTRRAEETVKQAEIPVFRTAREDLFIQLTMDVEYLKVLHIRSIPLRDFNHDQSTAVQRLLDDIANNLDPVNTELYLPHLRRLARSAADESQLVTVFTPVANTASDATDPNLPATQLNSMDVFAKGLSNAAGSRFMLLPVPTRTQYSSPTPQLTDRALHAAAMPSEQQAESSTSNILPAKAFSFVGEVGTSFINSASSMLRSNSSSSSWK